MKFLSAILFSLIIISSCTDSKNEIYDNFTFKIGITRKPSALLPFKRRGRAELQINPYIFLQLADYDPKSHELIPTLLDSLPLETKVDTGKYKGLLKYSIVLNKKAKWDNGNPITANDYIFSVKILLNPMIDIHPAIRSQFKNIKDIVLDQTNPQKVDVYTINGYILSKELVTNMEVYPEYFYDPLKIMRKFSYEEFLNSSRILKILQETKGAKEFASKFNSSYFMRDNISNIGPYKLDEWVANQYISLKKKENWWGDLNKKNTYLQNNPNRILFKIIPDKTTAITELKNGNIDLLSDISGTDFKKLKEDTIYKKSLSFYSPLALKYTSLVLNNRNPILKDRKVRKALAHLIDIDFIINTFGTGKEKRINSPIHPNKSYYNSNLHIIEYNLEKAKSTLFEAGWKDTNNNGVIDKLIEGKRTELKLNFIIIGRQVEKNVALLLKENAKKAGIDIEIINKNKKAYRKISKSFSFDIIFKQIGKDLVDYDPFPRWHSENISSGKSNLSGFHTLKCDSLIKQILKEKDISKKEILYLKFQEIIHEEQPVIFLYVPTNNIIMNKKYKITTSIKRPGYFANSANYK